MSARRTAVRFTLATAMVAALTLGGAAAATQAAGEPDGLYSATGGEVGTNFVQLDKTDATATNLSDPLLNRVIISVEVVNGLGYAIGLTDGVYSVFTWDITTGAILTSVPVSLEGVDLETAQLFALDTTNDGTLLTYLRIGQEVGQMWIVSIDSVSGVLTPLVDVTNVDADLETRRIFEGLATNPVTGVTYALADYNDGVPAYSPVDLNAGTVGASEALTGIAESVGTGYIREGDFDASGVLWFIYSGEGTPVARTNGPTEVGTEGTTLGDPEILSKAITVGQTIVAPAPAPAPAPEPQLAATGFDAAPLIGGAGVLVALGLGLLVARRRATV